MVCFLADAYGYSTDDIILLRARHVPELDEPTGNFINVSLHLILPVRLHNPEFERGWVWSKVAILQAAILQRGPRTDPPCNGLLRPRQIADRPQGPPQPYAPNWMDEKDERPHHGCILRGGAKHSRDSRDGEKSSKQQMMAWAEDKVQRHAPVALGPTLTMLTKAEQRTTTTGRLGVTVHTEA